MIIGGYNVEEVGVIDQLKITKNLIDIIAGFIV